MQSDSHQLPTLDLLQVSELPDVDAVAVARGWFSSFKTALASKSVDAVVQHFYGDGFWVDNLALTWDYRTFRGLDAIRKLLGARLKDVDLAGLELEEDEFRGPELQRPYPDVAFMRFCFSFTTGVGRGTGVCNLVPFPEGTWRAYTMFTVLESLAGFPEQIDHLRPRGGERGTYEDQRRRELEIVENSRTVLIVGAGHSGLMTAARLKCLGIDSLIIDKRERVGDMWRNRYKYLCLHSTPYYNEMPYMPFPATWPRYASGYEMGDWLEAYAKFMRLDVWTSSKILKAAWDDSQKRWTIEVDRGGREVRTLTVKHLMFATGLTGPPKIPEVKDMDVFKGKVFHAAQFTSARDHVGECKKAVVVGACLSGHDVAHDFCEAGMDVTMYQRSATIVLSHPPADEVLGAYFLQGFPTEVADIYLNYLPLKTRFRMAQRRTRQVASTIDRELIQNLENAGFKTTLGPGDAGFGPLLLTPRGGGHYINTGTSQLIIDGRIKVKNGSAIARMTECGIAFEDGTELEADIVVFATGFKDQRTEMWGVLDKEVGEKVPPIWGVNEEGFMPANWRPCGVENLWFGIGGFAASRFYSKLFALQLKAIEEGLYDKPDLGF